MRKQQRENDPVGTGELKAVAEEALRLGARALEKSREWFNEMTDNFTDRSDDMRHQGERNRGERGRDPYGREAQQQRPRSQQAGSRGDYDDGDDYAAGPSTGSSGRDWDELSTRGADRHGHERGGGYMPERGREYGHASGYDSGRQDYGRQHDGREDYGRGWRDDRGQDQARSSRSHSGERSLYGAHGPDIERAYYDSGWRASGFDERSQSVGWEDDRGDAPGTSRGSRFGGSRGGYSRFGPSYGGESAGRGGREGLYDYSEHRPQQTRGGGEDRSYSDRGGRGYGQGYGRSSGYADRSGFSASAYGSGFDANPGAYREQGVASQRGRGPSRYTRSDERITEDLNERLTEDELIDASDIEVRCENGRIVLEGEVDQRWMKHRAEDIADACSGVKDVDNRIRVRGGGRTGSDHGGDRHNETGSGPQAGQDSQGQGQASQRGASAGQPRTGTLPGTSAPPSSSTGSGATGTGTAGNQGGGAQTH
ncbi:BON domain-containing protein [Lysobacter antibioticus]|uniref:BON domain-containing protein n=1 Tax=Lysobacter antibioticus TaxID=84531 RepID=UPI000345969C|nr:BON domain-containing protein [Lysobacter antibioticus]